MNRRAGLWYMSAVDELHVPEGGAVVHGGDVPKGGMNRRAGLWFMLGIDRRAGLWFMVVLLANLGYNGGVRLLLQEEIQVGN